MSGKSPNMQRKRYQLNHENPMKTFSSLLLALWAIFAVAYAQSESYRVLISAYNQPVQAAYFDGLPSAVVLRVAAQGMYRYYMEGFATETEAAQAAAAAKALGFAHARVVAPKSPSDATNCCLVYAPSQLIAEPAVATRGIDMATRGMPPANAIQNIFFNFDKADIRPDAKTELDKLAKLMREHPAYKVSVYAHTDTMGSDDYNFKLSARRRDAAIKYLTNAGIAADRISADIFGKTQPIAKNTLNGKDNPIGRQFNRRVEFTVTEYGQRIDIVAPIPVPVDMRED